MLAPPAWPVQSVGEVADRADDAGVDQAADLVDRQLDQSGVGRFVVGRVGGADRQDGEGGQGEGGEAVPGVPAADLVLVQADLALGGPEGFFDGPADAGDQAHADMPTVTPVVPEGPSVAECDAKLARYRAALEAGADPAVVAGWIAETQAERQRVEQRQHTPVEEKADTAPHFSQEQIIAIVEKLGDLVSALRDAEPEHKLEVYRSLGLNLTYDPETQTVRASVDLATHRWDSVRVRGVIDTATPPTACTDTDVMIDYGR